MPYAARQSVFVLISSLKFEISCETWVRASPVNCAAAGSCVSWLRLSRAAVRCRFTASVSTDCAPAEGCCPAWACAGGVVCAGSLGVGVVAGLGLAVVLLGDCADALAAGVDGLAAAAAAAALALADGSSAPGDGVLPPVEAANAVRCVRTSCSLALAASSRPGAAFDAVLPVVPAAPGSGAPVVPSPPSSSVRIRSAAASSVLALVLLLPAGAEDLPADADDERCSAVMCRFNSATRLFAVPVNDAAGISFNAASALRRCSFEELCAPAGREAEGVCEGVGLVCCAQLPTGIASSADAAIAVVQLAVERFIAWLLPEQKT